MHKAPNYTGRTGEQIISEKVFFDSVGYVYRSLSWLDLAKRKKNVCALQYAGQEARLAIEQLLFEEIVLSVGSQLSRREYEKCRGSSTTLHKILRRLSPDYDKLSIFTDAVTSLLPQSLPLVHWDHKKLMKLWGKVSVYLHWPGEPKETIDSKEWFDKGIEDIEKAAMYIWENKKAGNTGVMLPSGMAPEIKELWELFLDGKIDLNSVKKRVDIAMPVFEARVNLRK